MFALLCFVLAALASPFKSKRQQKTGNMADHRHHLTMPARFCSQNAEPVLSVVVGDALEEAGQHFLG